MTSVVNCGWLRSNLTCGTHTSVTGGGFNRVNLFLIRG